MVKTIHAPEIRDSALRRYTRAAKNTMFSCVSIILCNVSIFLSSSIWPSSFYSKIRKSLPNSFRRLKPAACMQPSKAFSQLYRFRRTPSTTNRPVVSLAAQVDSTMIWLFSSIGSCSTGISERAAIVFKYCTNASPPPEYNV